MKLSAASLAAAAVASRHAGDPEFNRLHATPRGEVVATNGRAIMVVEPVDPPRAGLFPKVEREEAEPGPGGVGVPLDVVAAAVSSIPKEDKPSLRYAQVTRCSGAEVELMTTDGARKRKFSAPPMRGTLRERTQRRTGWRDVVEDAWRGAGGARRRVLVDRRSLVNLLQAIDRACPDKVNRNPVFLEVGESDEPIILRGFNGETNQHVVGVIRPLGAGGKWLRKSPWEAELAGEGGVRRIKGEPLARRGEEA